MIYSIYSSFDSTIYENAPNQNTGIDSILELTKIVNGTDIYNSRILTKFDITDISASIANGTITNPKFYLNLYTADVYEIPYSYNIESNIISQSWQQGIGKSDDTPETIEGVSWVYRDGYTPGTIWLTSSYSDGSTGDYITNTGGGTWYTASAASHSFEFEGTDLRLDVTNMVNYWLSGELPNNGFIVKYDYDTEHLLNQSQTIKFFSRDTHTIYPPKLEVAWDDTQYISGSISLLTGDDIILYVKNNKGEYKDTSKVKFRIGARPRYVAKTFGTSSAYLTNYRLPATSYYSIVDASSEDVVIPFDDNYTKISCDATSSYFNLWCNGLQPERNYRFIFKVVTTDEEMYYDDGYYFKIVR